MMEFPEIRKASILLIDDDEGITMAIKAGLELPDIELDVRTANTGLAGLQEAKKDPPDIVILDLGLPDMDGFEVLDEIRKDSQLTNTRVIMLTAKDNPANLWEGIDRHLDDFIGKPFDLPELEARVFNQLLILAEAKRK